MCHRIITVVIPSKNGRSYPDVIRKYLVPQDFDKKKYQQKIYSTYGQAYRGKQCILQY